VNTPAVLFLCTHNAGRSQMATRFGRSRRHRAPRPRAAGRTGRRRAGQRPRRL